MEALASYDYEGQDAPPFGWQAVVLGAGVVAIAGVPGYSGKGAARNFLRVLSEKHNTFLDKCVLCVCMCVRVRVCACA